MKTLIITLMTATILLDSIGDILAKHGTIFDYVLVPLCGVSLGITVGLYLWDRRNV